MIHTLPLNIWEIFKVTTLTDEDGVNQFRAKKSRCHGYHLIRKKPNHLVYVEGCTVETRGWWLKLCESRACRFIYKVGPIYGQNFTLAESPRLFLVFWVVPLEMVNSTAD